jgi:hypothetical protein
MALIDKGQIRYRGEPSDFIAQAKGAVWSTTVALEQVGNIEKNFSIIGSVRHIDGVSLRVLGDRETVAGLPNSKMLDPTLEDAYIWVMEQNSSVQVIQ